MCSACGHVIPWLDTTPHCSAAALRALRKWVTKIIIPADERQRTWGLYIPAHREHVPCARDSTADLHGLSEGRSVGDPAGSDISRALLLPPPCNSSLHTHHLPWTLDCPNQPKLQKWLCCWFIPEGKVQAGAPVIGGWSFCSVCSTEWETFQFSGTLQHCKGLTLPLALHGVNRRPAAGASRAGGSPRPEPGSVHRSEQSLLPVALCG